MLQKLWVHKKPYRRYRNVITGLDMNQTLLSEYENVGNASGGTHLVTQQTSLESTVSQHPFEKLSWDIMGPLPQTSSGNKYIVVVTDLYSKWVEAFPMKSTDTETLASLLVTEIVCRYGVDKMKYLTEL